MTINTKILFPILIVLIFQNCTNSTSLQPPTKEEMAIGLEEANKKRMKLETALKIIKDLDRGILQAEKEGKPILLIFTGFAVINSRKLESGVILKNEKIFSLMKDKFVNVWLYVDDKETNWKKWSDLQAFEFNGNYQPQIFILDSKGNKLNGGIGYKESKEELLPLLEKYVQ